MFLFGGGGMAHAQTSQVLVSNFGQTTVTSGGTEHGVAQGFRTGSNPTGYTVTSIDLQLSGGNPTVSLRRGSPTGSTVPGFTAGSATLEPNTSYWVVATGGGFGWLWSVAGPGEDATSAPGWSIADRGQSFNPNSDSWEDNGGDLAWQIRVNGTIRQPPPPPQATPDLEVGSPSVSDDSPAAGASFTLSATVSNSGDGESAATTLRYYRSTNATITTSDTEEGIDAVGALTASASSSESIGLTAPSTAGTYYYGACVDSVTGESDTTNNCSGSAQVTVPERPVQTTPDLTVGSPTVDDSSQVVGTTFTLSATVRNDGDGDSTATTLRYYRSTDATISTADTEEGNQTVASLVASVSYVGSVDLTAPSTPGTYYYGACVDAVTDESNITNNCSTAVQVEVSEPEPVPTLPLLWQLLLALGLATAGARLTHRRQRVPPEE